MMGGKGYRTLSTPAWDASSRPGFPRKFYRLFVISIIVAAFVAVHYAVKLTSPTHHAPYTPPDRDYEIHGKYISQTPKTREALYPLSPFPETPMIETPGTNTTAQGHKPWLAAVISSAFDPERRMIIRATWMRTFKDLPFDARFVVSNPGPQWTEVLQAENRTFGDLIVLDHLQEDDFTANTVKTLEFYKYLIRRGLRYEFVSKLDTDLYLNARGFYDRYLRPRLDANNKATVERTAIGELYYYNDLTFLHGSIYTYTWDMIEELAELQDRFHAMAGEDVLVSILLLQARRVVNLVNFLGSEKFDYYEPDARGDGTPWARKATHPNATKHALYGPDPIAIHNLKRKDEYLDIAAAFDHNGIKPMPPGSDARWPSPAMLWLDFWHAFGFTTYLTPRVQKIPKYFYTRLPDGDWLIDGIWNVGKTKTGHQERHL